MVFFTIFAFRGGPWRSGDFASHSFPPYGLQLTPTPNAQHITAKQSKWRRMTATPLRQKPHKGGNGCILVEFYPILVLLGVPWGSGAVASLSLPPYGTQFPPTPNVLPTKPSKGWRVTATPLRQMPHKGDFVYSSGVYPYFGVPWRAVGFRGFRFALISPHVAVKLPQYPTRNVLPRKHLRVDGDTRAPEAT